MNRRLLPMGDRAVLVEGGDHDPSPAGLAASIRAAGLAGVVDVVPGASTVLVSVDGPQHLPAVSRALATLPAAEQAQEAEVVVLPVVYDGPDLQAVADAAGLAPADVVRLHLGATYQVAFCGFAPGFGYLTGLDPRLQLPRRPEPRTRVPAGSVAVAGPYTAVYPHATPGGWHLLGTCPRRLWEPSAERPGLLAPGTVVRFELA